MFLAVTLGLVDEVEHVEGYSAGYVDLVTNFAANFRLIRTNFCGVFQPLVDVANMPYISRVKWPSVFPKEARENGSVLHKFCDRI